MSEYIIQEETLTEIADAIRSKTSTTEEIATSDMANQILSISGGGGSIELYTSEEIDDVFDEIPEGTVFGITDDYSSGDSISIDHGDEDDFNTWSQIAKDGEIFIRTDDNDVNSVSNIEFLNDFFVMSDGYTLTNNSNIIKIGNAIIGDVQIQKSSNFDINVANTFATINSKYTPLVKGIQTYGALSVNTYTVTSNLGYITISNKTNGTFEIWITEGLYSTIKFNFVLMKAGD